MKLIADQIITRELAFHFAYSTSIKVQPEPHSHDFYEFFITFDDEVNHFVNGAEQILENGSLVLIRPEDEHLFEKEGAHSIHLLNVAFRKETFDSMCEFLEFPTFIQSLLECDLPKVISLQKVEQQWIKKSFEELAFSPETNKSMIKHRFKMQLIHLFVHFFQKNMRLDGPTIPPWLSVLRTHMQQKENFPAGLPKLIELSGKSQEHVNRMIKKFYGMTTTEWLNSFKVQHAANLLLYSEMEIIEVSIDAGFENLSYFYEVFKRHFALTPAAYRRANKKMIV